MDPVTAIANFAAAGLNAYAAMINRLTDTQFQTISGWVIEDLKFFRSLIKPPTA